MQHLAGSGGENMSKPVHACGMPLHVVQGSCRRIPNMSCWSDAHCRLVRVVASEQAQFMEKVALLVGGGSVACRCVMFSLVVLIIKEQFGLFLFGCCLGVCVCLL